MAYLSAWSPDELAQDRFAPAFNASWTCAEGLIGTRVQDLAERIDATCTAMSESRNARRSSAQAPGVDPGWIEIRAMAREALGLLERWDADAARQWRDLEDVVTRCARIDPPHGRGEAVAEFPGTGCG